MLQLLIRITNRLDWQNLPEPPAAPVPSETEQQILLGRVKYQKWLYAREQWQRRRDLNAQWKESKEHEQLRTRLWQRMK